MHPYIDPIRDPVGGRASLARLRCVITSRSKPVIDCHSPISWTWCSAPPVVDNSSITGCPPVLFRWFQVNIIFPCFSFQLLDPFSKVVHLTFEIWMSDFLQDFVQLIFHVFLIHRCCCHVFFNRLYNKKNIDYMLICDNWAFLAPSSVRFGPAYQWFARWNTNKYNVCSNQSIFKASTEFMRYFVFWFISFSSRKDYKNTSWKDEEKHKRP